MTQAELAGGMANARQARPAKGQLIRDFTLTSTLGEPISLSDYRGSSNLVLVFAAGGKMAVLISRFWLRSRQTMPGFWTSRRRCWPFCSVVRKKQPGSRSKQTCPFLCSSMRMGKHIAVRALRTTTVTPPQQFILPTGSGRCLPCTERQRDRRCPTRRRL